MMAFTSVKTVMTAMVVLLASADALHWQCTAEDGICDGGVYPTYVCGKKCGIGYYNAGKNAYWYIKGNPDLSCFDRCCGDSGKGYCSW